MLHYRLHSRITRIKNFDKIPSEIKKLSLLFFVYMLFVYLVEPFIPVYINNIVGGYAETGLIFSLFGLIMIISDLPVSKFIERFGIRFSTAIGIMLRAVASICYAIVPTLSGITLARLLDGLSTPFSWNPSWLKIRVFAPKRLRSEGFSIFALGVLSGSVLGTLIGIYILLILGMQHITTLFLISAVCLIIPIAMLYKTKKVKHHEKINLRKMLRFRKCVYEPMLFVLVIAMTSTGLAMFLPLFVKSLGGGIFLIGMITIFHRTPGLLQYKFAEFGDEFGKKRVMYYLALCSIPLFVISYFVNNIPLMFTMVFAEFILIESIVNNNEGYAADVFYKSHENELTGMMQMFKHIGIFAGPLVMGIVAQIFGINTIFLISAALSFALVLLIKFTN